ncbi:MAG: acyltransferase [Myxococcota bacterium]
MSYKDDWKLGTPGHAALRELHESLRADVMKRWKRALPLGDELFDRWEQAQFLGFGEGTSIYNTSLVLGEVKVGRNVWVGPFTVLDGRGGLTLGDWVQISSGVHVYSHDTVKQALTGGAAPEERNPTVIEDNVYVGPQTVITRGVTVGHHSVIGAHSLVNQSIPPYSIAYGVPARVRGRVEVRGADVLFHHDKD